MLLRTRHSCRGAHQGQRRRDKIALFPSEGSGSTCCAAGCSSPLWRLYYHIVRNGGGNSPLLRLYYHIIWNAGGNSPLWQLYIIILFETRVAALTCGEVRRPVVAADCKEDGAHCRHCCPAPSHLYYKIYCAYRKRIHVWSVWGNSKLKWKSRFPPPSAQYSASDPCEGCRLHIRSGSRTGFLPRLQTNKLSLPGQRKRVKYYMATNFKSTCFMRTSNICQSAAKYQQICMVMNKIDPSSFASSSWCSSFPSFSYLWLSLSCPVGGETSSLLGHQVVAHCL